MDAVIDVLILFAFCFVIYLFVEHLWVIIVLTILVVFIIIGIKQGRKKEEENKKRSVYDEGLEKTTAIIFDVYDLLRREETKNLTDECSGYLDSKDCCYRFFVDCAVVWNESRFQASVKGIVSNNQKIYFGQNNNYTARMIRCDDSAGFVEIRGHKV